jgi:YbbR domain-containing protein
MKLRTRVLGWLTHNFFWKVLAVAGSVAIWVLVASEPELSTFKTVRLEFRNLPDDIEVSSAPRESVTLELRGPAGELRGPGDAKEPAVVLDMTGELPGQHTFEIGAGNVVLPRGVTLVRAIPSEVRFEFERLAWKSIPVQVRFTGEGASGYVVSRYSVSPENLVIEGPADHVAQVRGAETDPVDVSSAPAGGQWRVNAFVADPYVHFRTPPEVLVSVTMKKQPR